MAALVYPDSLPCPQRASFQRREARALSGLPGQRRSRTLYRDRGGVEPVQFLMSFEQVATWLAWLAADLLEGGAWFAATWRLPSGRDGVYRFIEAPSYPEFVPLVGWRVSALVEVRGRGMAPQSHASSEVACQLLLHFNQSDPDTWLDYSQHHRVISIERAASDIDFDASGKYAGAARFIQLNPGSATGPNTAATIRADGEIVLGADEFFMSVWVNLDGVQLDTSENRNSFAIIENRLAQSPGPRSWFFAITAVSVTAQVPQCTLQFIGGTTATVTGSNSVPIPAGAWTHIAASRKNDPGGDRLRVFVNGVETNQTSIAHGAVVDTSTLAYSRIGAKENATSVGITSLIDGFHGLMDELYVNTGAGTGVASTFTPPIIPYSATFNPPPFV